MHRILILVVAAVLASVPADEPSVAMRDVPASGQLVMESGARDFVLDSFAVRYLPPESGASAVQPIIKCGWAVDQWVAEGHTMVLESDLIARARRLQAAYAPEELSRGPYISIQACTTFRCTGLVDVSSGAWDRLID